MPKQSQGPRLVQRKNKPNWFIRYMDDRTGKQKDFSTGFKDRENAEEKLEEFLRQRRSTRIGLAVLHNQFTVAQALDDYAHHKMGAKSAERLSYSIPHLLDFWHNHTIDHINVETIERYRQIGIGSGRAQSTVRRELIDLRSSTNHAVSMNRVISLRFPKLPKDSSPKLRWLTESEFAKLLRAAGKNNQAKFTLRLFLIIAFYSGARKTAIMELEWEQVDFVNNTINFNKVNVETSNKRRPFIPIPPEIRRFLWRRFQRYAHLAPFVFHKRRNPNIRVKQIDKGFRTAVKLAKLTDVTPHTLRHTRISLLLQSGERPINVSNYVGVSVTTLLKVYGHHCNTDIQEMAQRLGRTQKVRKTDE